MIGYLCTVASVVHFVLTHRSFNSTKLVAFSEDVIINKVCILLIYIHKLNLTDGLRFNPYIYGATSIYLVISNILLSPIGEENYELTSVINIRINVLTEVLTCYVTNLYIFVVAK